MTRPSDPDRDLPDPGHVSTLCHTCLRREMEHPDDDECVECEPCREAREDREHDESLAAGDEDT